MKPSKRGLWKAVEEAGSPDAADMPVFGFWSDDGQLVDEQGKPIEAALFVAKRNTNAPQ